MRNAPFASVSALLFASAALRPLTRKQLPMTRILAAVLLAVSSLAFAQAPANPPVRIRGTLEKIEGTSLTVRTASGETRNIRA